MGKRKGLLALLLVVAITFGFMPIKAFAAEERNTSYEETLAYNLKQLGLFKGVSETEFDLRREPQRDEALVMLIRLLGKESEAISGTWRHPFTDVAPWADKYVGYAYQTGLTNGISATEFGVGKADACQYLTFVLRSLGYSDTNGADFTWNNPFDLASSIGLIQEGTDLNTFWRADVVRISYVALPVKLKDSEKSLSEKLIENGVFTQSQYNLYYTTAVHEDDAAVNQTGTVLTSEQVSKACAPAVFYIATYALNGSYAGSGSGFFISSDGVAVTNFHVAANSCMLEITTHDGKKYTDVSIIDADEENDLALLKVNGTGFPYLELSNSNEVVQGQVVYAFGSPLGLDNTMSQGIISNPKRDIDGVEYIQISVPIAPGSSGGALVDQYGKVVGVTSAGFIEAAGDLNLAIPCKRIEALNKASTDNCILVKEEVYPGSESVYDFGAYSGVDLLSAIYTPLGLYLEYDAFDFEDRGDMTEGDLFAYAIYNYCNLLTNKGFKHTQVMNSFCGIFENDTEWVYFNVDLEKERVITVMTEVFPQYYPEIPDLPDLGWYFGFAPQAATPINGSLMYAYKWTDLYSADDFINILDYYYMWLTDEGFVQAYQDSTTALYEGNGLSVVFIIDGAMLYVDVAAL